MFRKTLLNWPPTEKNRYLRIFEFKRIVLVLSLIPSFALSNFGRVNWCVKIYSASPNFFVDRLQADNWSLFSFLLRKLPCSCTTATKWKYSCCQVWFPFFKKTELFICIFARGRCPIAKGFIDACVFDSVMQALTVDLQEKSIKIIIMILLLLLLLFLLLLLLLLSLL